MSDYRGRFAPTPSGPLHAGSLLTALASWLCARAAGGRWLLRIDDLDAARCRPEHATHILQQLQAHGLYWDESPRWQSQQVEHYRAALAMLESAEQLYRCRCTRAVLAREQHSGVDGSVYSGRCRQLGIRGGDTALRLRVAPGTAVLADAAQGRLTRDIERDIGDFVLRRRDGIIGYHLACAIDEHQQGITEVVRGADLIGPTFCQQQIFTALGLQAPTYRHLPLLLDAHGRKLSKQNHAPLIDPTQAPANLHASLRRLGQNPPDTLSTDTVDTVLNWALAHWNPSRIPSGHSVAAGAPVVG